MAFNSLKEHLSLILDIRAHQEPKGILYRDFTTHENLNFLANIFYSSKASRTLGFPRGRQTKHHTLCPIRLLNSSSSPNTMK